MNNSTDHALIIPITIQVLAITETALSIVPLVLHGVGIYLLNKATSIANNQKLYMTHLSILEISLTVLQTIFLHLKEHPFLIVYYNYVLLVSCVAGFVWNNVLITLTLDRFLQIYLNLKYQLYVTKKWTKFIIAFCYVLGLCSVVAIVGLSNVDHQISIGIIRKYFYSAYAVLVTTVFAITYCYIYIRIIRGRNTVIGRQSSRTGEKGGQGRSVFIPYWIVFTYIVFIVIPGIVFYVLSTVLKEKILIILAFDVWRLFWLIAFITDALIYILLHESIRKEFWVLMRCEKCGTERREERNSLSMKMNELEPLQNC